MDFRRSLAEGIPRDSPNWCGVARLGGRGPRPAAEAETDDTSA